VKRQIVGGVRPARTCTIGKAHEAVHLWLIAGTDRQQLVDADDLLPLLFEGSLIPTQSLQPCLSPSQSLGRNAESMHEYVYGQGEVMPDIATPGALAHSQERAQIGNPDSTALSVFQHAPRHPVMEWLGAEHVQFMHIAGVVHTLTALMT
jgi:hypothetical protein